MQSFFYWSSSANEVDPGFAWVTNLGFGTLIGNLSKASSNVVVWPVRGGQ